MSSTTSSWAKLRQQARSLEVQTETIFHTYSQLAATGNLPPKPSEDEKETENKLYEILDRREALIGQLTRLLDSEAALTASSLKQNNLMRHREILLEHRKEMTGLKSQIEAARDRANLLSSVRSDINAHRANDPESGEADYMLGERRRIDNSHNMVDSVLSQAYAVNEGFVLQRETLASINRRITSTAALVPGLNNLIGKISAKKRRDGLIMAVFIALCFVFFFYLR
ncbi:Bgt-762 [Blumeria graminis f. sp. tritici]|uniref:Golgi SNAP receptor complex member 1 n=2 Tax=Blumeria graminis f. sp. tritici TaxID=62690 RepID=A0A061HME1_BLUGR|nr:v-SNARE protein [Blumeria graminis f. sp. tritici 96224]VDB90606.1 Bgt-762 [Blumeria graminis f. sp. tritici]